MPVQTNFLPARRDRVHLAQPARSLAVGPFFRLAWRRSRDTKIAAVFWLPAKLRPPADDDAEPMTLREPPADVSVEVDRAGGARTSGTESPQKVPCSAGVIWHTSAASSRAMAADDVAARASAYHCAQLDVFLGPAIYLGATNIITGQPRPEVILPLIAAHAITSFFAPPSVWISLLRSPLFDATDLSSLQKGYYGASIMPVEVLRELQRRLPAVRLWNLYGQTEIAPLATVLKPEDQLRKAGSAGKPVLNVETRVVDDALNDVRPGEIGEIVHRSPQLLQGYFNEPEKTEQAFGGGWFHSGDLATVDGEGYITIVRT